MEISVTQASDGCI